MQVANVSTSSRSLRDEIYGWTFEDAGLLVRKGITSNPNKIYIGFTPAPKQIPHYTTILEMLADGWVLLGPPTREVHQLEDGKTLEEWDWWLTRDRTEAR